MKMKVYPLMKKPASARHFTLVVAGKSDLKLSHCNMAVSPPAEQPASMAYNHRSSNSETKNRNGYMRPR
ncbi:hypothetical protein HanIR_Chr13g0653441 [Helianthus annuus]|nr:hypothetical protein HanIR_Chr13g0653441 [Helianthus annuus]